MKSNTIIDYVFNQQLYLENPQTYIVSASRSILNKENKNSALLLNEGQQIDN